MRVLVIIPAYNEEECLAGTVDSFVKECPQFDYLVVNDGSKDSTGDIIAKNGYAGVNLPINTGLTSAFRTGMKYAHRNGYDAAIQFDADGQHIPTFIAPMVEAMEREHADVVIASRLVNGGKLGGMRGVGSTMISGLIKLTSGVRITDPTSGMRLYSARMIRNFAKDFDYAPEPDTIALAARQKYAIVEVPVTMQDRQGGESYLKLSAIVKYMARTILSIVLFQWFR
ncbi:MAG: glycosyltransferase [Coriobacteriia bacterium]|nr:glycosyltransferase [Coriobacteriia bacterium]